MACEFVVDVALAVPRKNLVLLLALRLLQGAWWLGLIITSTSISHLITTCALLGSCQTWGRVRSVRNHLAPIEGDEQGLGPLDGHLIVVGNYKDANEVWVVTQHGNPFQIVVAAIGALPKELGGGGVARGIVHATDAGCKAPEVGAAFQNIEPSATVKIRANGHKAI